MSFAPNNTKPKAILPRAHHYRIRLLRGLIFSLWFGIAPLQAQPIAAMPSARSGQQSIIPESLVNVDAYILGPGDQVELIILDPGAKSIGGSFDILNDGSASLALLGSVVLEGLTLNQATQWLRSLYKPYLVQPDLNLRLIRPRPLQVSVLGEVERPGIYSLTSAEVSLAEGGPSTSLAGLPTVVTAIQKAGGLTLNADLGTVRLQRRLPGVQAQLRETTIDLISLLQNGDKTQNPFLFDGDSIFVSKAHNPDKDMLELAAANLSPKSIRVSVVGEVVQPGRIELQANTPIIQAILAAGGPKNWRGRRSDVELVRINRNGTATRELFRIDYSQSVSGVRNPLLRDGDTIIVNRSRYAVVSDGIDAIANPITGLVNMWGLLRLIQNTNL